VLDEPARDDDVEMLSIPRVHPVREEILVDDVIGRQPVVPEQPTVHVGAGRRVLDAIRVDAEAASQLDEERPWRAPYLDGLETRGARQKARIQTVPQDGLLVRSHVRQEGEPEAGERPPAP
jgi:hypothetical protein